MAVDPLLVLLGLAFLPALVYLAGLSARHPGRSWRLGLAGFLYGCSLSLVVLVGLYVILAVFLGDPTRAFQAFFPERGANEALQRDFVVIVLVAPLLEEAAKGFGVVLLGARLQSGRDGILLGASVGLGFAAIETFTYLLVALQDTGSTATRATFLGLVLIAGLRSITAALMHPAATGATGLGVARARLAGRPVFAAFPYYLVAVVLHGGYNYLAAFLPPQVIGGVAVELNLPAAILLAALAWGAVKRGVARAG